MRFSSKLGKALILSFALLLGSLPAFAQLEKGAISGTVTDPTRAVVQNATVTVSSPSTGQTRTVTTNETGAYTVSSLPPGTYDVKVKSKGFGEFSQQYSVAPGTRGTVDAQLRAAGQETIVEVIGRSDTQVDTETSAITQVVDAARVSSLPTLTRDPYDFVQTLGNVNQDSASGSGGRDEVVRGAGVSIGGARSASTDILLDGGENVDLYTTKVGQSVPLDSVQEFSVTSSNFSAEYGRASGGVINVATKAGTNSFHGSLYEFNRVSALTANDYNDNALGNRKQKYTRNQFGYSLGGPIVKNKLFFFSSTEWQRTRSAANVTTTIIDPSFLAATDPATQSFFSAQGASLRSSLKVNQVLNQTTAQIAPNATDHPLLFAYLQANPTAPLLDIVSYTTPTDAGGGFPKNEYSTTHRVDFNLTDKTTMFARYSLFSQKLFDGVINNSPYGGYDTGQTEFNNNFMYSITHVFSPNLVSDSKITFTRLNLKDPLAKHPVSPTLYFNINFAATDPQGNIISLPGYSQTTPGNAIPFGGPQNLAQFIEAVSWNRGAHQFRFGGEYIYTRDNRTFGAYQNAVQALNGATNTDDMELLMEGQANWFQVVIDPQGKFPCIRNVNGSYNITPECSINLPATQPSFARSNRYNDLAFYGQDTWKIRPHFTLNLGLRWEYYGVQHNKNPKLDSNFVYGTGSTIFDKVRNGKVYTVDATPNSPASPVGGLWRKNLHNFAPRVGFAWDIFGDGMTSLRGGYGLGYERNFGNVTFNVIQNPPGQFNSIFNPAGAISSNNLGPFAGSSGTKFLPNPSLRYVKQDLPTAYNEMWNLSLERELRARTLLALEYSGSHGIHLYSIENLNQAGFGVNYLGTDPAVAPFAINDRLSHQYGNMNTRGANGFSSYHAMNVRLNSANLFNQGLDFSANYTYSHTIDNLSSTFSETPQTINLGLLDPFNPKLDKGSADYDARHRIVLSAVWALPYAKGTHGVARQALDGWEVAPIITARTGQPFTIFNTFNYNGRDTVFARYIPSAKIPLTGTSSNAGTVGPNTYTYINAPAPIDFANALTGSGELPDCNTTTNGSGNLVSTGQNCHFPSNMTRRNAFRGPGWYDINLSLAKGFPITERFKLQFRSEFYNLLNHSNYYVQGGSSADASAGHDANGNPIAFPIVGKRGVNPAAGVANERRFIQFALKLTF